MEKGLGGKFFNLHQKKMSQVIWRVSFQLDPDRSQEVKSLPQNHGREDKKVKWSTLTQRRKAHRGKVFTLHSKETKQGG